MSQSAAVYKSFKNDIKSEERLSKLQSTTFSSKLSFEEKIESLLRLGLDAFNLKIAILSQIKDNDYIVLSAISPDNTIAPNTVFQFKDTYCVRTLENGGPTSVHNAEQSEWKNHPCYQKFGLGSYIGCPVYVAGEIFGTLNFSSPSPQPSPFTESDAEFLQLMAQWVGLELERQNSEIKLKQQNDLLAAISRACEQFIANADPRKVFDNMLLDLLDLSDSEYGFIGEVLYQSDGTPYLKTYALTNIAWNEETRKFYDENAPSGLEFFNLNTLFGTVLRTGKPVIANDPMHDERRGGLPEGHPALNFFLGIPLYHGQKFVGIAGVSNRKQGYDEELLTYLDPLLKTCSNIISAIKNSLEREQAEAALKESEERFYTIFKYAPFGVLLVDLKGHPKFANIAFQKFIGYSEDELRQLTFAEFTFDDDREKSKAAVATLVSGKCDQYQTEKRYYHKSGKVIWGNLAITLVRDINQGAIDQVGYTERELMNMGLIDLTPDYDKQSFIKLISPLVQGEKTSYTFETTHQRKDGADIPVEIFLQYISPDGERPRFVAIVRDITERKKIDKMKSEFISTVSHELRTPLTSIRGSLSLIDGGSMGDVPEHMASLVNIAHRNSIRLIDLINDILDMDKVTSGKLDLHLDEYELKQLLRQSIESNDGYADQFDVKIDLLEPIPHIKVNVDSNRFNQIMAKLLSNACKFSLANGHVEVSAEVKNNNVTISVQDFGSGIPIEFQDKLFSKFTQADSSNTRQRNGTGLGLCITKLLLELMGSDIAFNSEPGFGTVFYFSLPVIRMKN